MRISVLFAATVVVASVLFTVNPEQDPKQYDISSVDLSQIVEEGMQAGLDSAKCSPNRDISVANAQNGIARNGIPIYSVTITNICATECDISNIHVSCGKFSSATLVNPRTFKRLQYGDCLVNDGQPLKYGSAIAFTYQTTFKFPLSVTSVTC